MPKASKKKKGKALRHDPLEHQIRESLEAGHLKAPKAGKEKEESTADFVPDRLTKKIMATAYEQQAELTEGPPGTETKVALKLEAEDGEDSDMENDGLEEEEEDEDNDGDTGLGDVDEKELSMFMPTAQSSRRTLADLIFSKIAEKQTQASAPAASSEHALDPAVIDVYTQVGDFLSKYTSGKVPKVFKLIPNLKNWEEILVVTNPDKWTPQAYFVATRLFSSNLNEKMAQRFYNTVLLPKIREDIELHKKLNFHLYGSIKKAIYKPAAFFRGLLLPLAADCTAREAMILASILAKISIPVLHASVALLKLAEMPYSGPCTLFMKTLLDKKYNLPYRVIDALTTYFTKFQTDDRVLPVIWHQNVLMFVQRYKNNLSAEQRTALKGLLRTHQHPTISAEIRRELAAAAVEET